MANANANTKEDLIQSIKEWVRLDNEIRSLHTEITTRKKEKNQITDKLIKVMKATGLDAVDIKDGQICYTKKNVKKPVTQKFLLELLGKYFQGDIVKASELNNFINENRVEETTEKIVRKIHNTAK